MGMIKSAKLVYAGFFLLGASVALLLQGLIPPSMLTEANARIMAEEGFPVIPRTGPHAQKNLPPCGKIEALEIPIARPDGSFPDREERLRPPRWIFEGLSESSLTRYLRSCDLRPREKRLLLDKRSWTVSSNGCVITPSTELIWTMTHETRGRIYSILAKSPTNYPQYFAFRFGGPGFEETFKRSNLPQEQIERIRSLTYTNLGYVCFADLKAAEGALKPAEFQDLVATLCTVPAYLLRLHINKDSDIAGLIKYWGKGGRERFIAPFLTSLARVPGGGAINVSYLLPPFPRLRLYTYPDAWEQPTAAREDCLYTALNFFNEKPDRSYLEQATREKIWSSEYERVKDQPCLGDLISLLDAQDRPFHTCVYIADGFVFTKNGNNLLQPWVLMKITDMLAIYDSIEKTKQIVFLRRRA